MKNKSQVTMSSLPFAIIGISNSFSITNLSGKINEVQELKNLGVWFDTGESDTTQLVEKHAELQLEIYSKNKYYLELYLVAADSGVSTSTSETTSSQDTDAIATAVSGPCQLIRLGRYMGKSFARDTDVYFHNSVRLNLTEQFKTLLKYRAERSWSGSGSPYSALLGIVYSTDNATPVEVTGYLIHAYDAKARTILHQ